MVLIDCFNVLSFFHFVNLAIVKRCVFCRALLKCIALLSSLWIVLSLIFTNLVLLVLLDFPLAYKYKYTKRYTKKHWIKIALKYKASEWQGGTGDQPLYKAVLPQRMSPETRKSYFCCQWSLCHFLVVYLLIVRRCVFFRALYKCIALLLLEFDLLATIWDK